MKLSTILTFTAIGASALTAMTAAQAADLEDLERCRHRFREIGEQHRLARIDLLHRFHAWEEFGAFHHFAGLFDLAHRFGEHPGIMFGVLRKVFSSDAVARQLGITVQLIILFDDLLRGAAHLAIRARAVENPVDDIAARGSIVVAVLIAPRP